MEFDSIGIVLEDNYVLGLAHAVRVSSSYDVMTPFGVLAMPQKVESEEFFIRGRKVKLLGQDGDIVVLRPPEPLLDKIPLALGDSDRLKEGTKVIVLGNSFLKGLEVKIGVVSRVKIGNEYDKGYNLSGYFVLTAPINSGDSGAPVLAFRNGRIEVVGVVGATYVRANGISFAIPVNEVKKSVEKIKREDRMT